MKRIFYSGLALFGILASASSVSAQTVDVAVVMISPSGTEASPSSIPCTDSFNYEFLLINKGPAAIGALDTVYFYSPFVGDGFANITAHGGVAIPADDTIVHYAGKMKRSQIVRLADPTDGTWLFAPFANGTYFYGVQFAGFGNSSVITDGDETNDGDAAYVKIDCTTGIKDVNFSKTALNIYPNPASNQISFTNEFKATGTAVVKVTDIAGRTVKTINLGKQNAGSKTFNVDIAELNNGMYYIELTTDDTRSISKFTKN